MSRLKFYEASHRYRLDGEWTPSVTGIIGICDKDGLLDWYARMAAEWATENRYAEMENEEFCKLAHAAPKTSRDAAGGMGTQIHTAAEEMANGRVVEVPDEIAGHVEQAKRFMVEWAPEFVHTEVRLFNENDHWCGTADFIARVPGYGLVVGDYKSNAKGIAKKAKDISLQLAAYAHATHMVVDGEDVPMLPVESQALAVWIGANNYEVRPVDAGDLTYRYFRYCHETYLYCKKLAKAAMGEPVDPPEVLEASA